MLNCIIVDNNKADRKTIENIISQIKNLKIVKTYKNLDDAKEVLAKQTIDVLFLNIAAPGKNGIGTLQEVNQDKLKIIVTSGTKDAAHEAYDIDAVDFILKPVTVPRLIKSISKALNIKDRMDGETTLSNSGIFIKVNKHLVKIALKDIYLVEALADYVNIYTTSKRFTIHATMKAMERKLPIKDYVRVHKSSIVRIDRISEVKRATLSIEKKTIKISNTYRKDLMERLQVI